MARTQPHDTITESAGFWGLTGSDGDEARKYADNRVVVCETGDARFTLFSARATKSHV